MLYLLEETEDKIKCICECGKENLVEKRKVKLNRLTDEYLLKFIIKCDNCKEVHDKISLMSIEDMNLENQHEKLQYELSNAKREFAKRSSKVVNISDRLK